MLIRLLYTTYRYEYTKNDVDNYLFNVKWSSVAFYKSIFVLANRSMEFVVMYFTVFFLNGLTFQIFLLFIFDLGDGINIPLRKKSNQTK